MPDLTIQRVVDRDEWSGQHGDFVCYRILADDGNQYDWNRKVTSPEPEPGLQIEAEIAEGKFRQKLRDVQILGNASGERKEEPEPLSQAGGAREEPTTPARPGFDDRQWSIVRQHSQEMAVRLLAIRGMEKMPGTPKDWLIQWVDFFQQDASPSGEDGGTGDVSEDGDAPTSPVAADLMAQVRRSKVTDQDVRAWLGAKGIGGSGSVYNLLDQLPPSEIPTMRAWLDAVEHVTSQMSE